MKFIIIYSLVTIISLLIYELRSKFYLKVRHLFVMIILLLFLLCIIVLHMFNAIEIVFNFLTLQAKFLKIPFTFKNIHNRYPLGQLSYLLIGIPSGST